MKIVPVILSLTKLLHHNHRQINRIRANRQVILLRIQATALRIQLQARHRKKDIIKMSISF